LTSFLYKPDAPALTSLVSHTDWKDWLDEHAIGSAESSEAVMTDIQPPDIEYFRRDLINRMDALPFF